MRVVVLSESPADVAAVRVLVDAVLDVETSAPDLPNLIAPPGWPGVRNVLPGAVKQLHYHTDVEGLVVVADSDRSIVHVDQHDAMEGGEPGCRLCELRRTLRAITNTLAPRIGQAPLKIAVGVAVPAVEAWYVRGVDPHVNEAAWKRALRDRQFPYTTVSLKEKVYGTSRPSLSHETQHAVGSARRV
ncbi:MAG TPA: hypothetical protein VF613_09760, partial [Longimicrobium sp.]